MNLPENLQIALKNYIDINCEDLKKNSQEISIKYRNNAGNNLDLLKTPTESMAYAISRMPATFSSCYSALSHTFELLENKPKNILDIGAGTGAATWAISELINFEHADCFEREISMINLGKQIMAHNQQNEKIEWQQFDLRKNKLNKTYDLIIASYVLNEFTDQERLEIFKNLWNETSDLLIIIEPGTPHNFEQIKTLRNYIIKNHGNIIAPCPHLNNCELKNDWCNFTARINRLQSHKIAKQGSAPYEDEKFIYMAFSKKQTSNCKARVIRHPQYAPKLVKLKLCTQTSEIEEKIITKSNTNYKLARDLKHGDIFNI